MKRNSQIDSDFWKAWNELAELRNTTLQSAFDYFLSYIFDALLLLSNEPRIMDIREVTINPAERKAMNTMFKVTSERLAKEPVDFLGHVLMASSQGNARMGQVFTPFAMARVCAYKTFPDYESFGNRFYVRISDECVGAGSMLIACHSRLLELGINPKRAIYIGDDLDFRCVQMSFIQLTLLGMAYIVKFGNALSARTMEVFQNGYFKEIYPEVKREDAMLDLLDLMKNGNSEAANSEGSHKALACTEKPASADTPSGAMQAQTAMLQT